MVEAVNIFPPEKKKSIIEKKRKKKNKMMSRDSYNATLKARCQVTTTALGGPSNDKHT